MMRAVFLCTATLYTFFGVCYMDIATYYIYLESCEDEFCYAVRGINISYNTENQDVSLLCTIPKPLDEEETLPRAIARAATTYIPDERDKLGLTPLQPCNDTNPLLLKHIQGDSHDIAVAVFYQDFGPHGPENECKHGDIFLHSVIIDFQPNGSVYIMTTINDFGVAIREKTNLTFNETSSHCSVFEDANKRACICKENHARKFCLDRLRQNLDTSGKSSEYYHIYGMRNINYMRYYYYFKIHRDRLVVGLYVQRYSASVLREAGGNESMSLCISYNGSASGAQYNWKRYICLSNNILVSKEQSNFTVFAKFHDNEWHSLMWFDYLRWSKSYDPGNCSYEEQILDGVVHPFAICMRRNVTEKFYKNVTQVDQTSSTLRITAEYNTSVQKTTQSTASPTTKTVMEPSSLLDQDDIEESLLRIAEMRNISGEIVTDVLSILDTYLNSTELASNNDSSRNFGYHGSIEIPSETVCGEGNHHEYILIYYLFSNQMLFVEKEKTEPANACEIRKRTQQNTPVLSAQLIDKSSMETIHQINVHKEYKTMAKIIFPVQPAAKLHGSIKLVYWEGEKWIDAKASKMTVENDHYVYLMTHLTDFTIVVDGLEMDPILCDVALDYISVIINFLSFVGLLILIGHLSIKRYLADCSTKKGCCMGHKIPMLPSKYEKTRQNYFVVLALFHLGFLLLSDSRDLVWPMTCDSAAMVLYWLLLTCILITTFQSLHILKILACNSLFENLLINILRRKVVLFLTLGIPTTVVLVIKSVLPQFFDREDYFCWIRPDYVVPAVVIPLGFLGLNSTFIFCVIFIRIALQGSIFGIYVMFGQSSVRTIISTSTASTRSDSSSASLISNGAKYMEKAFTLLCIQLMLGIPWICQYLTLFAPQLTAAHYIFTIVIGSQGLIFFMLFCYRKIKSRYS
ncbi:MeTHuselah like protein [Ditylenchus destructor]|uniref:MeTHuselah like protein n=1 Tax=Ditylenchus destructor TaxID=166010 RepID=A0AAD4MLD1_9BILA|nr:MeTHuselah like protein [Ditylenchus destructor]